MTEKPKRPSVRMDDDEIWTMLTNAHTGMFTTLRRDGVPISLPVWFAVIDRTVYVVTRGRKVDRVRHDSRASFLVEDGERWAELRAVHLTGTATVIDPDDELARRIADEMARKYSAYRTTTKAMPAQTRDHYTKSSGSTIAFAPDQRILNWDNRKLGIA